jgi:hypothetical protein
MKFRFLITFFWVVGALGLLGESQDQPQVSFGTVEIWVDAKDQPLAAYQIEFVFDDAGAKIAGIEGGGHAAFKKPPYYDPKALQQERVVIAAFSTAQSEALPRGKTRVTTIHYQGAGGPPFHGRVKLITAATAGGRKISAEVTFQIKGNHEKK